MYIIVLTICILCRKKIFECNKGSIQINDVGFVNPNIVHEFTVKHNKKEIEDYLLRAFIKQQTKREILLPYNFK